MHRLLRNHLKHVTGSRYAPWCPGPCASVFHNCSAGTLGFDRACIRRRPSWTFASHPHETLCGTIFWNICTHSSRCLDWLLCHTGSLRELFVFAYCWLYSCLMGSWVPTPGCFIKVSRVPIPGCYSSRPFGACSINQIHCFQCQLLLRNHCCCSISRTSSILTLRTSRTHKPLVTTEVAIFTQNWNRP